MKTEKRENKIDKIKRENILDGSNFYIPPSDIEAEKGLLGCLLVDYQTIFELYDYLKPECFYVEKNKIIYEAMLNLLSERNAIDYLTVSSKLKDKGNFDSIGGENYLNQLVSTIGSSFNAKSYADIIHKKSIYRNLILAGDNIKKIAQFQKEDIESSLDNAEKILHNISKKIHNYSFVTLDSILVPAYEKIEKLATGKEKVRGLRTGFPTLDKKISGFQPSDLIIIGARPSMGKTAFALDITRKIASKEFGYNSIAFFSLEMSKDQLLERIIAAESNIDSWRLRTGRLENLNDDLSRIQDKMDELSRKKIYIDDSSSSSVLKIKSSVRRLMNKDKVDLVIVDYLQLLAGNSNNNYNNNLVQEVTEISRNLKQMAKELNIPVIALSQLSRNIEHRSGTNLARPRLSDLRDSGSIEQDADLILFLHKEKSNDEEENPLGQKVELIISKHRNGPTGQIDLFFNKSSSSFEEITRDKFLENFEDE